MLRGSKGLAPWPRTPTVLLSGGLRPDLRSCIRSAVCQRCVCALLNLLWGKAPPFPETFVMVERGAELVPSLQEKIHMLCTNTAAEENLCKIYIYFFKLFFMYLILFLLCEYRVVLSFKGESTMTVDYCDVSNWSVGDRSFSVHYKSPVIGFLRWSALVMELTELWEERRGDPSHLAWEAQVCLPRRGCCLFLKKRRGRPAKRAVDHRTSQCVKLLPVSSQIWVVFDQRR